MSIPSIDHPTDRPNFSRVSLGEITIYFSYRTPVAFYAPATGRVVRENTWGPTTGKHLNWIDDGRKDERVSGVEFERLINMVTDSPHLIEEAPV